MFCFVVLSIIQTVWLQMIIEKGVFTFFKSGCCESLIYRSSEVRYLKTSWFSKHTGRSHFM